MPRMLLKMSGNRDQTLYRTAEAVEAGGLSYVVATDPIGNGLPLPMRCGVAAAVWYFYSDMVDGMVYAA